MSKACDDANIDYRKQYSAPAGALTMFMYIYIYMYTLGVKAY